MTSMVGFGVCGRGNTSMTNNHAIVIAAVALFLLEIGRYFASFFSLTVAMAKTILLFIALLALLYLAVSVKPQRKGMYGQGVIFIFLTLMVLRMFVDFFVDGREMFEYGSNYTIVVICGITILLPFLIFRRINIEFDVMQFSVMLIIPLMFFLSASANQLISGLAEVTLQGQFAGEANSVIQFGHLGTSLSMLSLFVLMRSHSKFRYLCLASLGVGLSCILFSGSRGAFLAVFVMGGYYILCTMSKRNFLFFLLVAVLLLNYYEGILTSLNTLLEENGITAFRRVLCSILEIGDGAQTGREYLYAIAIENIRNNFLLGKSYLLDNGMYVHNIFLEQYMALGVLGGSFFVYLNFIVLKCCYRIGKYYRQYIIIPMLFIQYLTFGCFSQTIYALTPYWLFMFLTLGIYSSKIRDFK